MKPARAIQRISTLLSLLLLACGGGSSSEKSISITIDSPVEGARIIGSRSIVVTGTVGEGAAVTVSTNGGAEAEALVSGGTFSATLTLDPRDNAIVARATKGAATASATANVFYPFLSLRTFQAASVVIGQPDFQAGGEISTTRFWGNPGWDGGQLYLSDLGRVLVYTGVPSSNGATPSFAVTEVNAGAPSALRLIQPVPLVYNGRMVLADSDLDRAFILGALPSANVTPAGFAIGGGSDCTLSGLDYPSSVFVVGGKLLVVDTGHNRILIWDSFPSSSGQPADMVLGQPDFTTCEARTSASGFLYPRDVWSDGERALVVDRANSRILGWSAFPTVNGQSADFVLGQPGFTSGIGGTSRGSLRHPSYLASNGNQLFVADSANARVLVWNLMPSTTGALPDVVLGQADFDHGTENDADQDGVVDDTPSASTLDGPMGILVLDDALIVGDSGNARYLVFRGQ